MKIKVILIAFLTVLLTISCSKQDIMASQYIVVEEISYPTDTKGIEITGGFELIIDKEIPDGSITIEANENIHEYINSTNDNERITFELDDRVKVTGDLVIRIYMNCNNLREFIASGGSIITIREQEEISNVSVDLSGGSIMYADLLCDNISAQLTGGSRLYIEGTTRNFNLVDCSGGSSVELYDNDPLTDAVTEANISLSGGSELSIEISNKISGSCSGGSRVYYTSNNSDLVTNFELSGGSRVEKL